MIKKEDFDINKFKVFIALTHTYLKSKKYTPLLSEEKMMEMGYEPLKSNEPFTPEIEVKVSINKINN